MKPPYSLPDFLEGRVDHLTYRRWLQRKAEAHARRDRKRTSSPVTVSGYKQQIHIAVCACNGFDHYTGEPLEWEKISTYNNADSKKHRSKYKARFALLPTVDHVPGADGKFEFVICGWRTNDAKNDLTHDEFIALCRRVIAHHERGL